MIFRKPIFIHYVYEMDRAIAFYSEVFGVTAPVSTPGWSELDFSVFRLALHILTPSVKDEAPIPHAGLNLEVDEIEPMAAQIVECGGELLELREATSRVPDRVAMFRDTEGNGFELRQYVGYPPGHE